MGLLRADLQALGNLPFSATGRRVAFGIGFGLVLLALMSWWVAQELLARPMLLRILEDQGGGGSLRALLGTALTPCPIAASWIGLALAQRQLFESQELTLWQQAPIAPWRPGAQILLRACFLALLWATALAGPLVLSLLSYSSAGPLAYALVPVALLLGTVPLICVLLAVQIVLVRFFAGRVLRFVFMLVAALASVGFSIWLLLGLFTPGARLHELTLAAAPTRQLPWAIDTAAELLATAATDTLHGATLRSALGWLGLAAAVFWFAARVHPAAVERHQLAEPPLLRRAASSWPSKVASTMRKKEFAQLLQQPGALVGFLIFALLVFALAREPRLFGNILGNRYLPIEVRHLGAMLFQWFIAVLLVLYQHMGRLAMWDGAQWSLYMTAPCAPGAILRGKLQAVAVFLLWPFVLVGAAGAHLLGANGATLLWYCAIALPGTLVALGVLAVVGTWPRLMRPDDGGQIAQGGRSFLAAIVLVLLFELAVSPGWLGWVLLSAHASDLAFGLRIADVEAHVGPVIGTAWAFGVFVCTVGVLIGARNYRILSRPR